MAKPTGRPRMEPGDKIRNDISIKFTDSQKAALRQMSRAQNNSMASIVRGFVAKGIREWERPSNERENYYF